MSTPRKPFDIVDVIARIEMLENDIGTIKDSIEKLSELVEHSFHAAYRNHKTLFEACNSTEEKVDRIILEIQTVQREVSHINR